MLGVKDFLGTPPRVRSLGPLREGSLSSGNVRVEIIHTLSCNNTLTFGILGISL